jgi:N-acetylmuramoyl-L-alanine amidase
MRAANIERMKRRLLREAVAENLDVIRGLPPRAVRPSSRALRRWLWRAPLLIIPLMFAGSTYVMSNAGEAARPVVRMPAAMTAESLPSILAARTTNARPERVAAASFPLAVKRVVLDAGHGGDDPGATIAGMSEKEITLDIGQRLKALLEEHGFEVVTTRENDSTIALRERARVANDSRSDIFVSIHVNSIIKYKSARGVETYYLGAATDPALKELAAAENRVSGYTLADMRRLLEGIYADARSEESSELAAAVQGALYSQLRKDDPKVENWGVKQAPFLVLVTTDMPAVLAEVGCISNEVEAELLRQPAHRQKIADALFDGIKAYAASGGTQQKGNERNG